MQVFRYSGLKKWTSLIGAVAIAGCTVAMIWLGIVFAMQGEPGLGFFLWVMGLGMLALAEFVWRDGRGKFGWRIEVNTDPEVPLIGLSLPKQRSYLTQAPAFHGVLTAKDIVSVQGREDSYESMGIGFSVTAYRLVLADGQSVFLGEDRPLPRTEETETMIGEAANAIAQACKLKLRWLRPAQGHAGIMAAWGVKSPPWPEAQP
jgi:hypothetical protein